MASSAPLNKIERAHQMYREGLYQDALGFYTEALSIAKTKQQKIALHSNRAACFLKLHDFKKAAEECSSVLEIDHNHTGALMLRAQTLVTLKEYQSALFDVNRLMELNPSSDVYKNLQARLRTQLSLAPIPECEAELEEEEVIDEEEPCSIEEEEEEEEKDEQEDKFPATVGIDSKAEVGKTSIIAEVIAAVEKTSIDGEVPKVPSIKESLAEGRDKKVEAKIMTTAEVTASQAQMVKETSKQPSEAWQAIPKPKGHLALDYARWDRVEDNSSEDDDDDDDEDSQPQYRFRVRTIGVQRVK